MKHGVELAERIHPDDSRPQTAGNRQILSGEDPATLTVDDPATDMSIAVANLPLTASRVGAAEATGTGLTDRFCGTGRRHATITTPANGVMRR
jgi:hypothetical protein